MGPIFFLHRKSSAKIFKNKNLSSIFKYFIFHKNIILKIRLKYVFRPNLNKFFEFTKYDITKCTKKFYKALIILTPILAKTNLKPGYKISVTLTGSLAQKLLLSIHPLSPNPKRILISKNKSSFHDFHFHWKLNIFLNLKNKIILPKLFSK